MSRASAVTSSQPDQRGRPLAGRGVGQRGEQPVEVGAGAVGQPGTLGLQGVGLHRHSSSSGSGSSAGASSSGRVGRRISRQESP